MDDTIYDILEQEREKRNYNITQMAHFLGISRPHYYRFKEFKHFENAHFGKIIYLLKKLGYQIKIEKSN